MDRSTASRQLARRIRLRRTQWGWSAQKLADAAAEAGTSSLTRDAIAKIESGARQSVTADEITALARVLHLSPTELLATESSAEALFGALHDLSRRSGNPNVRELARELGFPVRVLVDVFRGRTIPDWQTLEPVVHALGGDSGQFRELLRRATEEDTPGEPDADPEFEDFPWAGLLEGISSLGAQANPRQRKPFEVTRLFLEAGLTMADEDLGQLGGPDVGWRPISRDRVVRGATRLAEERGEATRPGLAAFRDRWQRTEDYLQDLVTYALNSTRWQEALDAARVELLDGLDGVVAGRARFSDLIVSVAEKDMSLRLRFARYLIFQLTLTVNDKFRRLAQKAHAQFFEVYSRSWVAAYDEALKKLGLTLRPGVDAEVLAKLFGCLAHGIVMIAAELGDDQFTQDADDRPLLADGVMLMILGSTDTGDGRSSRDGVDALLE